MNRTGAWCCLALALFGLLPRHAQAATPEPCDAVFESGIRNSGEDAERVYVLLNEQRQSGCILGSTDTTGIRALYLELQGAQGSDTAVIRERLFNAVIGQFDGLSSGSCEAADKIDCMVGRQVKALQDLRRELTGSTPDRKDPLLQFNSWFPVEANGAIAISRINLNEFLTRECTTGLKGKPCADAVGVAARLLRSGIAMDQLLAAYNRPLIDANTSFLTQNDREWDSYFNVLSVQYPWELAWNSHRFNKAVSREERARFPRAPTSKVIALHPSAGFEYVKQGSGGHSTQAAIVVEVLGFETWQWREGNGTNRWGASVAAALIDAEGMDDVGYGLFVRTPYHDVSVGVVRRDGKLGSQYHLLVNVDLAKLFKKYKNIDVKEFLRQ